MGMTEPTATRRWFRPTPGWLIFGVLVVEGLLWLSERLRWFPAGWAAAIVLVVVGATLLLMLFWFIGSLLFRWRFQFSVRSLLALTLIIAVPCSWIAERIRQVRREKEIVAAIEKLGGGVKWVTYDNGLPVLWGLLGDDLSHVNLVMLRESQVTDSDLDDLKELDRLEALVLGKTRITNAGLGRLKSLSQLKGLQLGGTQVTDAGLENLRGCTTSKGWGLVTPQSRMPGSNT